ncbi:hypothetical protein OQA88_2567 [Cercophora sp. LCS_1]
MKGLAILAVAVSLTVGVSGERGFEIVFDHSVNDYRVLPANRRNCRESNDARPNDGNSEFDNFFSWTDLCGQDQVNFYKDTDGSNKVRAYIHNGDGKEVALCFYDKIPSDIIRLITEAKFGRSCKSEQTMSSVA